MPVRTCVGCRLAADAAHLVRLGFRDGRLAVGSGPGRGAWVGPSVACLDLAVRRRALSRALRAEVNADEVARIRDSWPTEPHACPFPRGA